MGRLLDVQLKGLHRTNSHYSVMAEPKPVKKRHVRPPKRTPAPKPAPLARGTSPAAETMSGKIAKALPKPGAELK